MTDIKIATFNLENLFTRPVAMNLNNDNEGRQAIEDHAIANSIVAKTTYSTDDKHVLVSLSEKYKWHIMNPPQNALVQIQKIRGQLFRKPNNGPLEVIATGRDSWVGWFNLLTEDVEWRATYNTGRVISTVKPDILITIEVENRPTLDRFNKQVLESEFKFSYKHIMVIDGNDDRGIDVGIMSQFPIVEIKSHIDDRVNGRRIFSRDCPEYKITLPNGENIIVLPNHFKSKRNGDDVESQNRRRLQADTAIAIAKSALNTCDKILIAGDFNDTPNSTPLTSMFSDGFVDVISHSDYPTDRPGTFNTGLANNKIDYLLMSPTLQSKLITTGIERRGSYHPRIWDPFDTVTKKSEEASDHHLVWATFNI
ncbi:MAG TPA: endonuclease/exonuclease/phosphatase family protein [Prolixibacteraceae bacterium]|nr:endonuclease/exonuclease/phosphatase family protein [Prolixibacteraceae bacterium]